MPIPSLQLQKSPILCREAERLVHGVVVSKNCYNTVIVLSVALCDCCKPFVEIELSATAGWKCSCQLFSCRSTQNVKHCRNEICSTCLSKESISAIPCGNSKHPLPTRSFRFLRMALRSTSCALCLHFASKRSHPFVEDSGFVSHAEKHRFGHEVVVSKICCIFSHLPCRLSKCVEIDTPTVGCSGAASLSAAEIHKM